MISHPRSLLLSLGLFCAALASPLTAAAQLDDELELPPRDLSSPERFVVELRGGPYSPEMDDNPAFDSIFDDAGPLLSVEIDYILYRVPNILYFNVGGQAGWSRFTGGAIDLATGQQVSEETSLTMIPLSALASLRIDALPRKLHLPFIFTGKIGWTWAYWRTGTGERRDATGWSLGLAYGGQLALDLDTFEPAAARSMDEEWGINHSYLFFEFFRFDPTSKSLPIGDTTWAVGLGFTF